MKLLEINECGLKEKAALLAEYKKNEDLLETALTPNRPPTKQRAMTPKVKRQNP